MDAMLACMRRNRVMRRGRAVHAVLRNVARPQGGWATATAGHPGNGQRRAWPITGWRLQGLQAFDPLRRAQPTWPLTAPCRRDSSAFASCIHPQSSHEGMRDSLRGGNELTARNCPVMPTVAHYRLILRGCRCRTPVFRGSQPFWRQVGTTCMRLPPGGAGYAPGADRGAPVPGWQVYEDPGVGPPGEAAASSGGAADGRQTRSR